jgi:DNA mismatch repair protein MutS
MANTAENSTLSLDEPPFSADSHVFSTLPPLPSSVSKSTYQTLYSASIDLENTIPAVSPMIAQFLEVKRQYPGIILFYRMGDFYETFLEDALISARVLEITLTGRDAGGLGRIPMAGVPVKSVDAYIGKLLTQNFKVAICEQIDDPATTKGLLRRQVVRVLSSGTITEQTLLNADENNFLAALAIRPGTSICGLSYCDVTTGHFYVTELPSKDLFSELDRIRPVEILVRGRKKRAASIQELDSFLPDVPLELTQRFRCTPLPDDAFRTNDTRQVLLSLLKVKSLEGFGLEGASFKPSNAQVKVGDQTLALEAAGVIGYYILRNFPDQPPALSAIRRYSLQQTITMNAAARRNLELMETVRTGQSDGSLYAVLNKTGTSMGARLLRQWISLPLTDRNEIESRHEALEELFVHPEIREDIRDLLPEIYDIERLSTKVASLTVTPRDLVALKLSLARLPELSNRVKSFKSFYLTRMQEFPPEIFRVTALIERAIDDAPALSLKEGGLIKTGYHQELDKMRELLSTHQDWLNQYEAEQRERTGVKALKVSFNSAFGYFIELSRSNSHAAPSDYHRRQTLTNAERYTTDILKAHETQVLDAQSRQYELEYNLFIELRQQISGFSDILADCAHRVATLDALQSLATVAVENRYVKPIVDDSHELFIRQGRHPVVEKMLPLGAFVPNDAGLSGSTKTSQIPQLMMITGPNMAGKSTYMRQVALIVVMAQMGSFVPAEYARIGLVDGIYTRVGAVDDLAGGQSTFMVEMNETAQILNGATNRSLVLLDEVGRGTSTGDGVSIARAVAEHLVDVIGCRALFATHYHELNTLEQTHPRIANYRLKVTEMDGEIAFLHTVEPGTAQKSYGIQVARMAGIPARVIQRAERLLDRSYQQDSTRSEGRIAKEALAETPQLSLF